MEYRYETHMHTAESSACGRFTGAEQARRYKELGYTGIIITDHFFNGNCAVPRDLPWEQRAELFCAGYEHAREEGDRIGLEVYFGWEANYNGTEFLIYGLDKEWLIHHPEVMEWTIPDQFAMVNAAGGLVVQAHPYREASYIPEVRTFPQYAHGLEVYNEGNVGRNPLFNDRALDLARRTGKPMTSGSDAHGGERFYVGILTEERLHSIDDYVKLIRSGTGYRLADRLEYRDLSEEPRK